VTFWSIAAAIYLAGVVVGLVAVDGSAAIKCLLALLWPIGPLAFVVTIALLVVTAGVAFPIAGAVVLVAAIAAWMLW
jgi:hypothetical protein